MARPGCLRGGGGLIRVTLAGALLSACAAHFPAALPSCDPAITSAFHAWVVDYGWHTEVVVPVAAIEGPLAEIAALFPGARTLSFGFGKRSFMTRSDPGLLDFVAGAIPGAATVRVIGLIDEPGRIYPGRVVEIPLAEPHWVRLTAFLSRAIARDAAGTPVPVAAETGYPAPGRFFAATAGYSLTYTCNAWSVDALHTAGLPVGGDVVFAGGAMREAALLRGTCGP